jgi:hypothetical protein
MDDRRVSWRQWSLIAAGAAALLGVTEVVLSFGTEVQWAALVVGALFVGGAVLIGWEIARTVGLFLVAALFVMELAFVPVYSRDGLGDWVIQGSVAVVSAVGLAAAVASLMARRRSGLAHR